MNPTTPRPIHDIEAKWQATWEELGTYRTQDPATDSDRNQKFYGLVEFPFPSGEGIHMGHPRPYVAMDVMTRKRRMEGKNVLFPIGWDAFGLPTENFAIKFKVKPQDATKKNTDNFRRQLQSIGLGFDWSREVNTTDPKFFKWTQWQFLKFYQSWYDEGAQCARPIEELVIPAAVQAEGEEAVNAYRDERRLAYKAITTINWCPRCKIGLANEEAQGGVCERCGNPVEKREKAQWMIRITKYAERLINDLDQVDYLDRVKAQQTHWIGKSEGAYIDFAIKDTQDKITVFTTRPDTLFGVTYVVLAPEHPLVATWLKEGRVKNMLAVVSYQEEMARRSDMERTAEGKAKTGIVVEGVFAVHPVTGEEVPVWVADYVLASYGTGSVMAVPSHDERDFAFATTYQLPIKQVVAPVIVDAANPPRDGKKDVLRHMVECVVKHWEKDEYICLQWKRYGWKTFIVGGIEKGETAEEAAIREVQEETGYKNVRVVKTLGDETVWQYFAEHKDENRTAVTTGVFLELVNGEREELTAEEAAKHDVVWVPATEVTTFLQHGKKNISWPRVQGEVATPFCEEGVTINSDFLNELPTWKAKDDMTSWLEENGKGKRAIMYRLRDWVFSRQRYWGEPIPIVHCPEHGYVPVSEAQLPVTLPDVEAYEPSDTGESPLTSIRSWVETTCPTCGGPAERETDTMPNWAGSSWYFLRYIDPHNDETFASEEKMKYWLPIDLYNGGMEHTTLHLLYSRFWYKFLWDLGLIPKECGSEPYQVRRSQGLVLAADGEKMSKSKGNGVNPDDVVKEYGADVLRVYQMFMGPFDQPVPWNKENVEGVRRFLDKVWNVLQQSFLQESSAGLETLLHQTVKKLTQGIDDMQFNTCISQLMILTNAYQDAGGVPATHVESYLRILTPFAPHLTSELWQRLEKASDIHRAGWPVFDPSKLQAATFELVLQVNGKVRDRVQVESGISEAEAKEKALASEQVQKWLEGKQPKQVIYIVGKLVSVVA